MSRRLISLLLAGSALAAVQPVRIDVPFVAQLKDGCGAASAAMVMQYWRRATVVDAQQIHRSVYSPEARGTRAADLQRYLEQQGFRTFAFRGEWNDIRTHLAKGRPLIAALKTGRRDLHYVVLTGIEDEIVLKHDAAQRAYVKQHRRDFLDQWRGTNNWTLLALPAR